MNRRSHLFNAFLLLTLAGCSGTDSISKLQQNAKPNDNNVRIQKVLDAGTLRYVLVSNGKGYELSCEGNPGGLLKLVQASGYPMDFLNFFPASPLDSKEIQDLNIADQPKLTCQPGGKTFYQVEIGGETKYFFSATTGSTKLYMVGCYALTAAMGFDIKKALPLDSRLVGPNMPFNVDDAQDISCMKGAPVDGKVAWQSGPSGTLRVEPGSMLQTLVYEAYGLDGSDAPLLDTYSGSCQWLSSTPVSGALTMSGMVPQTFEGESCEVTVTAAKGTSMESTRKLALSTCAADQILQSDGQCARVARNWKKVADIALPDEEATFVSKTHGWKVGQTYGLADKGESCPGDEPPTHAIYGTTDGGKTWECQYGNRNVMEFMWFLNEKQGWATGVGGIVSTVDGGKTWTEQFLDQSEFYRKIRFQDAKNGWVLGQKELYRTADGGKTWLKSAEFPNMVNISDFTRVSLNEGYVIGWTTNSTRALWKTIDGGVNFQLVKDVPDKGALWIVAADRLTLFASGGDGIQRTRNGGLSWETVSMDGIRGGAGRFNEMQFFDKNRGWIKSGEWVYFTNDGGHTFVRKDKLAANQIFFPTADFGIAVTADGVFHTTVN
ncbi:MAG TPA: YCF48-related protein [Oligoflexus sp.]|uniref:WD40/YVTN/BNR-like repeat-containing protein n=1 Tax=Oligoflexus sp. TaxID=1971216 RepID=UPI002D27D26E|nr:YCF48-related protein [Oligoflexus sp.]HYX33282.1 YCF48-related protein [Oligoflexus sp.]